MTPEEALDFCINRCPRSGFGCAVDCELRKRFKIPPYGTKYPIAEPNYKKLSK